MEIGFPRWHLHMDFVGFEDTRVDLEMNEKLGVQFDVYRRHLEGTLQCSVTIRSVDPTLRGHPKAGRQSGRPQGPLFGREAPARTPQSPGSDSAIALGRQDLILRSAQLVQQCDGGSALRRIQFAITHKSSEGATGFDVVPHQATIRPSRARA